MPEPADQPDALGRQITQRLPMGQTNYAVYNSKGQLWKQYDFKGQRTEFVYDQFGRTEARFLFEAGATVPDEAVCYIYNQLNQLAEVVERYGADATTNACDGYAISEPYTPTKAREMPMEIKRWNSISVNRQGFFVR